MKNNPIVQSLGHAVLAFLYVVVVSLIMHAGGQVFENDKTFWGPIAFLLLFVVSAAIMGAIILGRPILLYLDGHKAAAVKFFGYTVAWILVLIVAIFTVQILK
jgi:hypothetical protein